MLFRSAGEALGWLRACGRDLPRPDLVAVDPPRSGLEPGLADTLGSLAPRRLAYVSCEPQTLLRDLRDLHHAGFLVERVVPFDMFPQTCHVESLVCLRRAQ